MKYLLAVLASVIGTTGVRAAEIHSVLAHPVFGEGYACVEHGADSLKWDLGDALGTHCFIRKLVEADGRALPRFYRGNGTQNEDWYGWQQDVLSPCTCKVIELHVNLLTNSPGVMGKEPASIVKLKRADGVVFVVVHFDKPRVKVGETIAGGSSRIRFERGADELFVAAPPLIRTQA